MPIYAYKCESCGFAKDVLQKMSDPELTVCLSCGEPSFKKQLTAAGFQLKGTGWYATDFKGATPAPASADSEATPATPTTTAASETTPVTSKSADSAKPSESTPAKTVAAPPASS